MRSHRIVTIYLVGEIQIRSNGCQLDRNAFAAVSTSKTILQYRSEEIITVTAVWMI